jgi:hypothetical protein
MAIAFERRLASFRAARVGLRPVGPDRVQDVSNAAAERLAADVDGELVRTPAGAFVRLDGRGDILPVDRLRLARLPGQPPPEAPLVCLDTETTGLATASGTLAFLVGLGWWEGARFRQVQLLLPDHAFEPALLEELGRHIPTDSWLVTYNGLTFDWPLLVARYRMARREAPAHAGHLDLLPFVRRVFRHRLSDARLRTVEGELLGRRRPTDIDGWEIPGRYFEFLRTGTARPLLDVIRHNDDDVRSLGLIVAVLEQRLGDSAARMASPPGDLAGLSRAYARERRLGEALACLDAAVAMLPPRLPARDPFGRTAIPVDSGDDGLEWLARRRRPDFGGRPLTPRSLPWRGFAAPTARDPWTPERILAERARLLRRVGRHEEAEAAWLAVAERGGPPAMRGWIEVAKLREHHLGDPAGALEATLVATRLVRRQLLANRLLSRLDRDLERRATRLRHRLRRPSGPRPLTDAASGAPPWLADPALGRPDRVFHAALPGLRPLRALDPPQVASPNRGAEAVEPVRRGRVGGKGRGEIRWNDERVDLVEGGP